MISLTAVAPTYDVLYDVATAQFEPNAFSIVGAGVGLGLGLWVYARPRENWHRAFAIAVIALSLLSVTATNWLLFRGHENLRSGYEAGAFVSVEGYVTAFRRGRPDCGQVTFAVEGRRFELKPGCEVFPGYQGRNVPDLTNKCVRVDVVEVGSAQRIAWIGIRHGECT